MDPNFPSNMNPNDGDNDDLLNLSLCTRTSIPPPPIDTDPIMVGPSRKRRALRQPGNLALRLGKSETIPQPYPWATTRRATIHSLQYLRGRGITSITGRVQCKRCNKQFDMEYNLCQKLSELEVFMLKNLEKMCHRAPEEWMNPTLSDCWFCHQGNCVKPVTSKKKDINWLFLLLGQTVGCCKLSELKYFCKHTRNHRTGAKDRVLYLTYLELCRQLHL